MKQQRAVRAAAAAAAATTATATAAAAPNEHEREGNEEAWEEDAEEEDEDEDEEDDGSGAARRGGKRRGNAAGGGARGAKRATAKTNGNGGGEGAKVSQFLTKVFALCESCDPEIAEWSADGRSFIVKSSRFADVLKDHFQSSLQTFVRQLHFYGFHKSDSAGTWSFSNPNFVRGHPELLVNIKRKPAAPKNGENGAPKRARGGAEASPPAGVADAAPGHASADPHASHRLSVLESQFSVMMAEMQALRSMLVPLAGLASSVSRSPMQSTLSLGASPPPPMPPPPSSSLLGRSLSLQSTSMPTVAAFAPPPSSTLAAAPLPSASATAPTPTQTQLQLLAAHAVAKEKALPTISPPPALGRGLSGGSDFSHIDMKDFPFEDTSSMGSVDPADLMRELQMGFAEMDDEALRSVSAQSVPLGGILASPSKSPMGTVATPQLGAALPSWASKQADRVSGSPPPPASSSSMSASSTPNVPTMTGGAVAAAPAAPAAAAEGVDAQPPTSLSQCASAGGACGGGAGSTFRVPEGFVLAPGVTMPLLKQVFDLIKATVCPTNQVCKNASNEASRLRWLCHARPHPATLPPPENCPVSLSMLPILRERVQEKVADIVLLRATRQVYEIFYNNIETRRQAAMAAGACTGAAGAPVAPAPTSAATSSSSSAAAAAAQAQPNAWQV